MPSGGRLLAPGSPEGVAGEGDTTKPTSAAGSPPACPTGGHGAEPCPTRPPHLANPPQYLLGPRWELAGVGHPLPPCKPCQASSRFPCVSRADPRSPTGAKTGEEILRRGQNAESHVPGRLAAPSAFPCSERALCSPAPAKPAFLPAGRGTLPRDRARRFPVPTPPAAGG